MVNIRLMEKVMNYGHKNDNLPQGKIKRKLIKHILDRKKIQKLK